VTLPATKTQRARLAHSLKAEARRLGFDACGISAAQRLSEEEARLAQWLAAGRHASMRWMENHYDKRLDPRLLVDGARSVISVIHNYYHPDPAGAPASGVPATDQVPGAGSPEEGGKRVGKISRYARGDDYHHVLKEKLFLLFEWLREEAGDVGGRAFVDSAPVMDKAWAARSGLGWIGKSTMLLNRQRGTFFFVGELIVDIDLPPDGPIPDYCGSCTRCLDACPTGALDAPYQIDANRCISYLTIEHRGSELPEGMSSELADWIFGCDICQDVCPWNKFSRVSDEERFAPRPGLASTELREWAEIDLEEFRRLFKNSPVKRTKFEGFQRNVRAALQAAGQRDG
jgi:epoxyqueuosine reductase